MTPRPYQQRAIEGVNAGWSQWRKQLIKLRQFGEPNADIMTKAQAGYFLGRRLNGGAGGMTILDGLAGRQCPQCGGSGKVCDPAQIGARMREHREAHKLSAREVARRMGFSAMYVCDLEHGRRGWSADLIEKYQEALAQH